MASSDPSTTRQRILLSAYELFLRQGYHGTSMRQLAASAGLTPAGIYTHFPSKEALFVELLSRHLPHRALVKALAEAKGATVDALVRDAYRGMAAALKGEFENMRLMFIEIQEFQGRHAPSLAEELLPECFTFFARLQQADGRLRDHSTMLVGRALIGLFMSYAITATFFGAVPALESSPDDPDALARILLYGIAEGEAPHSPHQGRP